MDIKPDIKALTLELSVPLNDWYVEAMRIDKPDMDADIEAVADRGEAVGLMEPMTLAEGSPHTGPLLDLALELTAASAGLKRSLPPEIASALADLVRLMNCYCSNLIEGHNTHPIDIERALENDYADDPGKRNLQREAKAHIEVQRWIDAGGVTGRVTTQENIMEIHRRFGKLMPEELLTATNPDTGERIRPVPGELRRRDVKSGVLSRSAPAHRVRAFEMRCDPIGKLPCAAETCLSGEAGIPVDARSFPGSGLDYLAE